MEGGLLFGLEQIMNDIPLVDLKLQYQSIKAELSQVIERVLSNASFIMGEELSSFERHFADYCGAKHAIGVASGTDALFLSLLALGIGPGSEVITTPHTFVATVEAILHVGAKPVFVDIDPATYTLDPAALEASISPRTRLILPVHLYGQPANMEAISEIAARYNLPIVEDAAQAHGAFYAQQPIGHHAKLTCFSFYPSKNLGAYGDGGAITTNDDELAGQVRLLRDHGSATKYQHSLVGYNSRLDALQAAMLDVKLRYLETWIEARQRNAAYYDARLSDVEGVIVPRADVQARHVYHLYVIQVPGDRDRDVVAARLKADGIHTGVHYPIPVHLQPGFSLLGYTSGDFPVTERVTKRILSLPLYPELTETQMDYVVERLCFVCSKSE
jgi:dTDP-4-amino-4,6-dideoxygalactose transaminase